MRIRSYANSGKPGTSENDSVRIIERYFHWSNNENTGAEFQFLLTGDLSALTRSGLTANL